jgi:hypothetical protein
VVVNKIGLQREILRLETTSEAGSAAGCWKGATKAAAQRWPVHQPSVAVADDDFVLARTGWAACTESEGDIVRTHPGATADYRSEEIAGFRGPASTVKRRFHSWPIRKSGGSEGRSRLNKES